MTFRNKYIVTFIALFIAVPVIAATVISDNDNGMKSKYLDFVLKNPSGEEFDMKSLQGKVVVVDFWDTWCPPCKAEIPGFVALKKKYKDKDFEIVGIALGQEGKKAVKDFIKEYKINYPVVINERRVLKAYPPFRGIPTTFIIDKKGKLVKTFTGFADEAQFEKVIKSIL